MSQTLVIPSLRHIDLDSHVVFGNPINCFEFPNNSMGFPCKIWELQRFHETPKLMRRSDIPTHNNFLFTSVQQTTELLQKSSKTIDILPVFFIPKWSPNWIFSMCPNPFIPYSYRPSYTPRSRLFHFPLKYTVIEISLDRFALWYIESDQDNCWPICYDFPSLPTFVLEENTKQIFGFINRGISHF